MLLQNNKCGPILPTTIHKSEPHQSQTAFFLLITGHANHCSNAKHNVHLTRRLKGFSDARLEGVFAYLPLWLNFGSDELRLKET